jgi:hypothetical protein
MSSERQNEANKLNAQRSTGPRTPEGKQRVASNALKHGLTGKQVVLPYENPDEFDEFRSALLKDLDPRGALEEILADKIVADAWRLRRVPGLEAALHRRDRQEQILRTLRAEINGFYDDGLIIAPLLVRLPSFDQEKLARLQDAVVEAETKADVPMFVVTRVLEKFARQFDNLPAARGSADKIDAQRVAGTRTFADVAGGEQFGAPAELGD